MKIRTNQCPVPHQPEGDMLPVKKVVASANGAAESPDPMIRQAKRDLDAGQVDTDMRATPGLDAKRRSKLVPREGGKPPKLTE